MMIEKTQKKVGSKENFLSIASSLCLIHCLVFPLIASILPSFGNQFESVFLEYALLVFSIICGAYVMFLGFKMHRKKTVVFVFALGCLCWLFHGFFEAFPFYVLELSLLLGTCLVILSYVLNQKNIKTCSCGK